MGSTDWGYVQYNILIVGSDFPGFSDTAISTFIFPLLGDLEDYLAPTDLKAKF